MNAQREKPPVKLSNEMRRLLAEAVRKDIVDSLQVLRGELDSLPVLTDCAKTIRDDVGSLLRELAKPNLTTAELLGAYERTLAVSFATPQEAQAASATVRALLPVDA